MNKLEINHKNCLCFATDMNYIKHLSVALESLLDKTAKYKSDFDVVIFENKLEYCAKKALESRYKKINIKFISVPDCLSGKSLVEKNHINKTAYLRYEIIDILSNYERVLYLDCDVIINENINEIFNINLNKYCIAAVRDTFHCYCNSPNNPAHITENKYVKEKLEIDDVYNYFNSGVILFNIPYILKKRYTSNYLFEITEEKQFKWMDQDALNYIFKDSILFIDQAWNCMVSEWLDFKSDLIYSIMPNKIYYQYQKAYNFPKIIHYAGNQQPIFNRKSAYFDLYWKYARTSLYYEDLLKIYLAKPTFKFRLKKFIKNHPFLYKLVLHIKK